MKKSNDTGEEYFPKLHIQFYKQDIHWITTLFKVNYTLLYQGQVS